MIQMFFMFFAMGLLYIAGYLRSKADSTGRSKDVYFTYDVISSISALIGGMIIVYMTQEIFIV